MRIGTVAYFSSLTVSSLLDDALFTLYDNQFSKAPNSIHFLCYESRKQGNLGMLFQDEVKIKGHFRRLWFQSRYRIGILCESENYLSESEIFSVYRNCDVFLLQQIFVNVKTTQPYSMIWSFPIAWCLWSCNMYFFGFHLFLSNIQNILAICQVEINQRTVSKSYWKIILRRLLRNFYDLGIIK